MRVFEITKEYAPAFEEFIPKYVLMQIGAPGFHTIGEVATDGEDYYAAGLLQYYDGALCLNGEARLVYLFVPEDERGESNAWSMLREMERHLFTLGIHRVEAYLGGKDRETLEGYFLERGFKPIEDGVPVLKTTFAEMMSEKLLALPKSDHVYLIDQVPRTELNRIIGRFSDRELAAAGISIEHGFDNNTKKLSFIYTDGETDGILISSVMPEGGVIIRALKSIGKDGAKATMVLLSYAGNVLKRVIPGDTPVYINDHSKNARKLIEKLKPDAEVFDVWRGEKSL